MLRLLKKINPYYLAIFIVLVLLSIVLPTTQKWMVSNTHRFDKEIRKFKELPIPKGKSITVFTGSSSIRLWKDLENDCKEDKIINTGFGGSMMEDLLLFLEETILRFKPDKVYIYEGDNDIAAKKSPNEILETTEQVVSKLLSSNPNISIYFIGAKPSTSRWQYKEKYLAFNSLLKAYCDDHDQLFYVDVWNKMLNTAGRPNPAIFISDSLHMNRKGYELWKDIICDDS